MRQLSVLIKPVSGTCNMRCSYCFYTDVMTHWRMPKAAVMSEETLEAVISKSLEEAEESCTFGFQGGEPVLAGLTFFEKVVEFQKKYNRKNLPIQNLLQTNGLLIDQNWAIFLRKNRFLVGVSIDGPADLHDRNRRDWMGGKTFARAESGIRILQEYGVDVNVLSVVTSYSIGREKEIYEYFRENGLHYQKYIPCMPPLFMEAEKWGHVPTAFQYGMFLIELFKIWREDRKRGISVYIRFFENILSVFGGGMPELCGMCGHCTNQYVVESDGSVYPCDFYVLETYVLGNLRYDSFRNLSFKQSKTHFIADSMKIHPECALCKWKGLCPECRRERQGRRLEQLGKNRYCQAYKMLFEYIVPQILDGNL